MPPDPNMMKSLKKLMKTEHGKNSKLVQEGINKAIREKNCDALKILLTSPLPAFSGEGCYYTSRTLFLHNAISCTSIEVLKILLADDRFDVNKVEICSKGEMPPLDLACQLGKMEMVKMLLEHPKLDVKHWNFIHKSIEHMKIKSFHMLLADHRFDVNQICRGMVVFGESEDMTPEEFTPLMLACQWEKQRHHEGIRASCEMKMVKSLIDHPRVDVNFMSKKTCNSALDYTRNLDIAQLLLNHKNVSHSYTQHKLIKKLRETCPLKFSKIQDKDSKEDMEFQFELVKILMGNNIENGFCLKNIFDVEYDQLGWFGTRIVEEMEMKIREEYYKGNFDVSEHTEESFGNEAFGLSMDIWQALLLKCKCVQCLFFKEQYKMEPDLPHIREQHGIYKIVPVFVSKFSDSGIGPSDTDHKNPKPKKKNVAKCIVEKKLSEMLYKNELCSFEDYCNITFLALLISTPMPEVLNNILLIESTSSEFNFANELDGIINGTMPIAEISQDHKLKNMIVQTDIQTRNDKRKVITYTIRWKQRIWAEINEEHSDIIERKENERKENERKENERKENERKENERKENERKETERKDTERKETERKETDRKENERKENERKEKIDGSSSCATEKPEAREDYSKLCWACSVTEVKLYKCGGCRKARYCSDKCIRDDRIEHMDYCDKVKEKRKLKKLS